MAGERTLPGLGLTGYWGLGDNSWKAGMDSNLLLLSVFGGRVAKSRTTTLPATPVLGDIYIVPAGEADAFKLAIWDGPAGAEAWVLVAPPVGTAFYVLDTAESVRWDGTGWADAGGPVEAVSAQTLLREVVADSASVAAGTGLESFRASPGMTVSEVRASLTGAATTGTVTVDLRTASGSILSTLLTIDAGETTSVSAAVPAVIAAPDIADDSEIFIDVTDAGAGDATGLKVSFRFTEYDAGATSAVLYPVRVAAGTVASDLTDFPVMVDLAGMPASFWPLAQADGGNIRAVASDGVSSLPVDVTSIDTVARTGRLFLKTTLLSGADNVFSIRLIESPATKAADTAPFGRDAVWADYEVVWVFPEVTNRTGKTFSETTGDISVAGDWGELSGQAAFVYVTPLNTSWTMASTIRWDEVSGVTQSAFMSTGYGSFSSYRATLLYHNLTNRIGIWNSSDGWLDSTVDMNYLDEKRMAFSQDGTVNRKLWLDGVLEASELGVTARPGNGGAAGADALWNGADHIDGDSQDAAYQYAWHRLEAMSDDWMAADGINGRTPAEFYTILGSPNVGKVLYVNNAYPSLADQGPAANTVTEVGTPLIDSVVQFEGADTMVLDGTDGVHVDGTGASASIANTDDFTWEAYVRPTSFTGINTIIGKRDSSSAEEGDMLLNQTTGVLRAFAYSGGTTIVNLTSDTPLALNVWAHVAFVRRNGEYNMFIDGVKQSESGSPVGVPAGNATPIYLGDNLFNTSRRFVGNIGPCRIVAGEAVYDGDFTPELFFNEV